MKKGARRRRQRGRKRGERRVVFVKGKMPYKYKKYKIFFI